MNNGLLSPNRNLPAELMWSTQGGAFNIGANLATSKPGVLISAPGTAHTLTSWVPIATTTFDSCLLSVHIQGVAAASTATGTLVDIGIGATSSETVFIDGLMMYGGSAGSGLDMPRTWTFPVRVPSGTQFSARLQSNYTGATQFMVSVEVTPDIPEFPAGTSIATVADLLRTSSTINTTSTVQSGTDRQQWKVVGDVPGRCLAAVPTVMSQGNLSSTGNNPGLADFGWWSQTGLTVSAVQAPPTAVWATDVWFQQDSGEGFWPDLPLIWFDPPIEGGSFGWSMDSFTGTTVAGVYAVML